MKTYEKINEITPTKNLALSEVHSIIDKISEMAEGEEIENLSPGDLVYHEYFGKGVVFDNSDVKRIEIRFGTDVRFVDKSACVAKKIMRKV